MLVPPYANDIIYKTRAQHTLVYIFATAGSKIDITISADMTILIAY